MKTLKKILFFSTVLVFASCESATSPDEEVDGEILATMDYPVSDCSTAPASWFTLNADGQRVTPMPNEGPTSVFANSTTVTNCDFHRWSWQKFLWLTNETNGRPFFLDNMNQVTSSGQFLAKGGDVILEDYGQASGAHDVDFIKTPGTSSLPSDTVYYSIMANDKLYEAIKKYGQIAHDSLNKIVDLTFPVGALEMKTAWIDANALGKDSTTYYITNALIGGATTSKRVALLGIHVVGIVENHPEFVWATFEHDGLVPAYDWSKATPTTDAPVTSTVNYPFFDKSATSTVKNITSATPNHTDIFSLYKYGTPVVKVLEGENGDDDIIDFMKTSQDGRQNVKNISELNASVKKQLILAEKDNKNVWQHYFYNGSLWIDMENIDKPAQAELLNALGGTIGDANPTKLPRGSVAAYNITMETYVQAGFGAHSIHGITVDSLASCFACHTTSHYGSSVNSPLQISHLFNGYVSSLKGMTKAQIKEEHIATFRANAILKAIKK
ncbi:MAG: hypothetical protein HRT58_11215 [Crocinitomicaceae bacterium]|nr:hypothetical protein [Flavobacteriales bacterium]NQZ36226.1 hypothetical protein [Crocinitomicaceae bacterium]